MLFWPLFDSTFYWLMMSQVSKSQDAFPSLVCLGNQILQKGKQKSSMWLNEIAAVHSLCFSVIPVNDCEGL